jgi:hypothetical protein
MKYFWLLVSFTYINSPSLGILLAGLGRGCFWSSIVDTEIEPNFVYHREHQLFSAKKLPKTDPNAGGPGAGQQRPKGNVDLQERNQGGSGGCCK